MFSMNTMAMMKAYLDFVRSIHQAPSSGVAKFATKLLQSLDLHGSPYQSISVQKRKVAMSVPI